MEILVAHPTRQHSHRLAWALENAGLLHSYWTLLPDRRGLSAIPNIFERVVPTSVVRNSLGEIPRTKVHTLFGPLLLQKVVSRSASSWVRLFGELFSWTLFDSWVSLNLKKSRPKLVVGYEMCCLRTFEVAKDLGITCVLDAAACHYKMQDRVLDDDRYGVKTIPGQHLRSLKKKEIELADKIICTSNLAKQSYLDAGVLEDRIVTNAMGCDVKKFSAVAHIERLGPLKFVFVGAASYHKGFDILVNSFKRVEEIFKRVELHIVGDPSAGAKMQKGDIEYLKLHGKLSHDSLALLLGEMDCLVLPSRLESFGMVVVEALAAGVSVIVSDHVGAHEAIKEGVNGWVVPAENEEALFERMLTCCKEIDRVRGMKTNNIQSAKAYDWSRYTERSLDIFKPLLERA